MDNSITVPQKHLEALLRSAELHESGSCIKLSLVQYSSLVQDAHRFSCLKAALILGGLSEESLDVLIDSQKSSCPEIDRDGHLGHDSHGANRTKQKRHRSSSESTSLEGPTLSPTPTSVSYSNGVELPCEVTRRQTLYDSCHADRSVVMTGIPDSASLLDCVKVIRGGLLLNIYIRRRVQSAYVSFVDPEAAEKFLDYGQRNKISVKNKMVEVRWADRQSFLTSPVVCRILNQKATRNLIIRFPGKDISVKTIKEDLDHIFRLEIIEIAFREGHVFIQLNGILHAISAKHCMQSRLRYKKSKIEFGTDECTEALPADTGYHTRPAISARSNKFANVAFVNRFQPLSSPSFETDSDGQIS